MGPVVGVELTSSGESKGTPWQGEQALGFSTFDPNSPRVVADWELFPFILNES